MREEIRHLLWGLLLYFLYVNLDAIELQLMHLCTALTHAQTLALIFVGEFTSLLPFSGVVWKEWSLKLKKEWLIFGMMGVLLTLQAGAAVYCSQHMLLGDFAAIAVGSILLYVPILTLIFQRRCMSVEEGVSMIVAVIGVVIITHSNLNSTEEETYTTSPVISYIFAILSGLPIALICFIIGHYPLVHWTTYLLTRTLAFGIFASIYILVMHYGLHESSTEAQLLFPERRSMFLPKREEQRLQQGQNQPNPPELWVSVTAAITVGFLSNVYQTASVYGCQEFEKFGKGNAGPIGSIFNTGHIVFSAIYAYLFFGEVMNGWAVLGAGLVVVAVVFVTIIKACKGTKEVEVEEIEEGDKDKEEEEEAEDVERKDYILWKKPANEEEEEESDDEDEKGEEEDVEKRGSRLKKKRRRRRGDVYEKLLQDSDTD